MKRNMWKVAKETKIPMAYDLTYSEAIQIKEKYESGETNPGLTLSLPLFGMVLHWRSGWRLIREREVQCNE